MATIFGKIIKGIGKGVKFAAQTALSVAGVQQIAPTVTSPVFYPPPSDMGTSPINGGMLPEVTVTAQATSSKPLGQKLIDLLDVASGNRPFQTSVGVSQDGMSKFIVPAAILGVGLMLYKLIKK